MRRRLPVLLALLSLATAAPPSPASSFLHKSLADWRRDLEAGKSPAARRSAAFALGRIGPLAAFAIDELARALRRDGDDGVREMAACAIGDIVVGIKHYRPDREWEVAGAALQEALAKDGSPRVRRAAAYALGAFGDVAGPSLPALKEALRDKAPSVRQNAAWALGRVGDGASSLQELCDALRDAGPLVRRDAAAALEELGRRLGAERLRPAAQPLLRLLVGERDDVVRKTALGTLATLTDESHRGLASDLYPYLDDKDPETRRKAAYALGNMGGEPARRALPELRKALADADPVVQALAAACLSKAGPDAAPAADDLARVLSLSKSPEVRGNCAVAMGRMCRDAPRGGGRGGVEEIAKRVMPALIDAIKPAPGVTDPAEARAVEMVRVLAAEAIGFVGQPFNESAIPTIREILKKDPSQPVRMFCVQCLFNLRDLDRHDLTPVLTAVLEEKDPESVMVRFETARLLAHSMRERAPDRTAATLVEMVHHPRLRVNLGSGAAIEGVTSEGAGGSSKVTESLGGDGRFLAAQAMAWLGDKARKNKELMEALRAAAEDPEPRLKEEARKTLKVLEGGG
jgi:HEAT repeat protein